MANEFGWNGESNPSAIQKRRHLMKHCVSLSDVSSGNWIHGAGNTSSNARQGNMDQTAFWKQISNIHHHIHHVHTGQEQLVIEMDKMHITRILIQPRS